MVLESSLFGFDIEGNGGNIALMGSCISCVKNEDQESDNQNTDNLEQETVNQETDNKNTEDEKVTKFIKDKNLSPTYRYDYLSDSTVKTRVYNETKPFAGIYLILNKLTMDYYIGSAYTGKLHARFINHLFEFKGSKILKNAVKEHKISSFAFMVLELFKTTVDQINNKNLIDLEDYYLKSLLPNYNILTEAGSTFGYKHSQMIRIDMQTKYSEEERQKVLFSCLECMGENLSANINKSNVQGALSGINNNLFPLEKAIKNKKKKTILVHNKDNTVYGEFNSIAKAAEKLGCREKSIVRSLKTKKKLLNRR